MILAAVAHAAKPPAWLEFMFVVIILALFAVIGSLVVVSATAIWRRAGRTLDVILQDVHDDEDSDEEGAA